jgi:hypothetical protein
MRFLKIGEDTLLPINNEMIFKVRYNESDASSRSHADAMLEVSYVDWPDDRSVSICDVSQIMLQAAADRPTLNELVELVFARRMVESVEVRFS